MLIPDKDLGKPARYLVGCSGVKKFPYFGIGSGTLVRFKESYWLVTAKHVTEPEDTNKGKIIPKKVSSIAGYNPPNDRDMVVASLVARPRVIDGISADSMIAGDFVLYKVKNKTPVPYPVFDLSSPTKTWLRNKNLKSAAMLAIGYPDFSSFVDWGKQHIRQQAMFLYGQYGRSHEKHKHIHYLEVRDVCMAGSGIFIDKYAKPQVFNGICGGPVLQILEKNNYRLAGMIISTGNAQVGYIDILPMYSALMQT